MKIYHLEVGPIQTNCYVAVNEDTKEAVVVDPGAEPRTILDALKKMELKVVAIFITHGHSDHIGALNAVRKETGAPVYISEIDAPALKDENKNLSMWMGGAFTCEPADHYFVEGEDVTVAGMTFKVFLTPGHTPGGVCLYNEEKKVAFVGDTIFCESVGRTDFPGGSYHDILESIKTKLLVLDDDVTLLPGHGPSTNVGWEKRRNPFLQ